MLLSAAFSTLLTVQKLLETKAAAQENEAKSKQIYILLRSLLKVHHTVTLMPRDCNCDVQPTYKILPLFQSCSFS